MCSHNAPERHADAAVIDRLADEITELASHIHAATCRWLGLVAEFDRRGGWSDWGCQSCAHWISWRCSITPVAAREHVRVARRLEQLPHIRAAFAEGRLSYSKVRALSRVENVEREQELLALAEHATAAQLERLMRAYRGVVAADRVAARGRPERYVSWDHGDDGSLLLRARLPAEEGAIMLAALEAGVQRLRGEQAAADASADAQFAAGVGAADSAPPGGGGASAEAPDADGAASAEAHPDLSERRADALVLMAEALIAGAPGARGGDRYQVVVHVDTATLTGDAGGRSELADGSPLAPATARRLACDAGLVALTERDGKPLSVGRETRSVPPGLRRALASRDRGCRFPGCANRCTIDAHHIEHWADGGATSLENLIQLCRFHHGLLHEGGYSVRPAAADFVFRRPDGRPIRAVPRAPRGHARALRDTNQRDGRRIHPEACVPLWAGERLDLGAGVDAMLAIAPLEAPGI